MSLRQRFTGRSDACRRTLGLAGVCRRTLGLARVCRRTLGLAEACRRTLGCRLALAFLWLAAVVTTAACSGGSAEDNTPEFQASLAAKQSYEALYVEGRPEVFLYSRVHYGEMPDDFRQQLLEGYRSHLRQVERANRGVKAVDVIRAQMDTTLNCMQVFLSLTYGDGRHEEVMVPMVLDAEGRWRLQ